jgi:Bacterial archaeo-eukaryotic release factor family 2
METSQAMPGGGVRAEDLASVVRGPGPFLTLYLETRPDIENAGPMIEQRWRTLRGELMDRGVPQEVLEHVDPVVSGAHLKGRCLAAVSTMGGLLHAEHGPEPPPQDATWAALPSLLPIIEWRQQRPGHVLVLTDRRGADLYAFRFGRADIHREAGGADDPLTRSGPGGWSQRRYQQRAENTWEDNAKDVAVEVERLVDAVDARLVLVAGDVRAVQLLREALRPELSASLHEIGGGRTADGSAEEIEMEVERLVDVWAGQSTTELITGFEQERGQQDKAASGAADVLAALAMSQVEILLVADGAANRRTAWFGRDPAQVALSREDVEALGARDPAEANLIDVCIRTALLTGARIGVIPAQAGVREGIGAILRWAPPTP